MDTAGFRKQVYEAAVPVLKGRTVTDIVIGISMLAVELDEKDIAVSYVLREDLGGGCSIFQYASKAPGMPAEKAAAWFAEGGDDLQRAIGGAVITAACRSLGLRDCGSREKPFDIDFSPDDTIGMIGNIRPVAMQLRKRAAEMIIFDKGKCSRGNAAEDIYPMERQAELLPGCDIVFISGTAAVNGTAPDIFRMCTGAREIVMLGSSVPMIPEGYRGTGVTILAGSWWRHEDKKDIFRLISQGAGMQILGRYMIKNNVRITG